MSNFVRVSENCLHIMMNMLVVNKNMKSYFLELFYVIVVHIRIYVRIICVSYVRKPVIAIYIRIYMRIVCVSCVRKPAIANN